MASGQSTDTLPSAPLVDTVLGNRTEGEVTNTVQISFTQFSTQLGAAGPLAVRILSIEGATGSPEAIAAITAMLSGKADMSAVTALLEAEVVERNDAIGLAVAGATEEIETVAAGKVDGKPRPRSSRAVGGWIAGILDQLGRMPFGVDEDGNAWFRGWNAREFLTAQSERSLGRIKASGARSGYAWGIVDSVNRIVLGLTEDARLIVRGQDVTDILGVGAPGGISARVDDVEADLYGSPDIICWGDSLTQNNSGGGTAYPAQLAALSGRSVLNRGVGGQAAANIAARAGGRAALLTVTSDEIPASGPVSVTARSIDILYYSNPVLTITGYLAGVHGTLRKETDTGGNSALVDYSFTRTDPGDAVRCLPGTPFIPDEVDPARIHVIWIGRNNYAGLTVSLDITNANTLIKSCIASIIGTMSPPVKRVIILGVTSSDTANEYVGTENYNGKRALAADLARDYPKSFIDIDAILRASGDSSPEDDAAIANGVIPPSLTVPDRLHLNDAGRAIVTSEVYNRILQNGW